MAYILESMPPDGGVFYGASMKALINYLLCTLFLMMAFLISMPSFADDGLICEAGITTPKTNWSTEKYGDAPYICNSGCRYNVDLMSLCFVTMDSCSGSFVSVGSQCPNENGVVPGGNFPDKDDEEYFDSNDNGIPDEFEYLLDLNKVELEAQVLCAGDTCEHVFRTVDNLNSMLDKMELNESKMIDAITNLNYQNIKYIREADGNIRNNVNSLINKLPSMMDAIAADSNRPVLRELYNMRNSDIDRHSEVLSEFESIKEILDSTEFGGNDEILTKLDDMTNSINVTLDAATSTDRALISIGSDVDKLVYDYEKSEKNSSLMREQILQRVNGSEDSIRNTVYNTSEEVLSVATSAKKYANAAKKNSAKNKSLLETLSNTIESNYDSVSNSIEALATSMSVDSKKALDESSLQTASLLRIEEGLASISGGSSTIDTDALGASIGESIQNGLGDSIGQAVGDGIGAGLGELSNGIGDVGDGIDGLKKLLAGNDLISVGDNPAALLTFDSEFLVGEPQFSAVQNEIDLLNDEADSKIAEFKKLMNFDTSMLDSGSYKEHALELILGGKQTSLRSGVLPALVENASLIYAVIMFLAVMGGIRMLGRN